jgi:hypothetical protein
MHINLMDNEFSISGRRVTLIQARGHESSYLIPRGARVTLMPLRDGVAQLIVGGFKTVTVTVTGPASTVRALRDELIDTATRK